MTKWNFDLVQSKRVFRLFMLICIPLTLILMSIIWAFYSVQVSSTHTVLKAAEYQAVQLALQSSTMGLNSVRSDLLFLADLTALQKFSNDAGLIDRDPLAIRFLAFVKRKAIYDQVRFLDVYGQEVVRVNWNQGQPQVVAARNLQNKVKQYYVSKTLALDRNEIYISPFDLNIEHGVIEQPVKPMIRFGTPVYDERGHKQGVIVLNYIGQKLIDRIKRISATEDSEGHIWLLNNDAYWLIGSRPEDEWGFMYSAKKDRRLDKLDDSAWEIIRNGAASGQFMTDQGLYTYVKFEQFNLGRNNTDAQVVADDHWILVAHRPAGFLAAKDKGLFQRLMMVFALLEIMLAAAVWAIAYYSARRHQAEESVRASESRFRALLESAPDAIVNVNRQGLIELANAQTEHYFGYSRDELQQKSMEILIPEYLRSGHFLQEVEGRANASSMAMGEGLDLRGRRKDGTEFPVEISMSPVHTPQGSMETVIIRDITARKQAEHLKLEAQERYRELVINLPVGIYRNTLDAPGYFLETNPAMLNMFAANSAGALTKHGVKDLFLKPEHYHAFNEKLIQRGYVRAEEVELVTLRGKSFWAAITAVVKIDVDGNRYCDGVIENIASRKEIQRQLHLMNDSLRQRSVELEAANHELEAFSYSVSHDLRAPLRAIDGFSRILQTDYISLLDDKGRNYLERIRLAAQHMGVLIDDLLKLSRVTRIELSREKIDLYDLANEIMTELMRLEPERVVYFDATPGIMAYADKNLMRVVLDNLFSNAWKFTSKLTEARIELGVLEQNGQVVYFMRDNGAGFDMAYADKLFGVFQRMHETREFPGTGIGLATVQRIIHKHGGRIWAESAINKGTTFYFTLAAEPLT